MTASTNPPFAASKAGFSASKYLTFTLGGESYGIAVAKVREIIRPLNITFVPQMPDFIKGVVNLRGKVIPIMDLRLRFQLPEAQETERTCVIVVQGDLSTLMGLVVDGMEEVMSIPVADIVPTPDFNASLEAACISGVALVKGGVKTLLDIDRLLKGDVAALSHKLAGACP